jgi:hypothetical protein
MGSGGSRSLWPPGKLFETHDAGVATGVTRLQSGQFLDLNAIVAFAMDKSKLHRINLSVQTT